jgi:hypothetical protein
MKAGTHVPVFVFVMENCVKQECMHDVMTLQLHVRSPAKKAS